MVNKHDFCYLLDLMLTELQLGMEVENPARHAQLQRQSSNSFLPKLIVARRHRLDEHLPALTFRLTASRTEQVNSSGCLSFCVMLLRVQCRSVAKDEGEASEPQRTVPVNIPAALRAILRGVSPEARTERITKLYYAKTILYFEAL